MTGSISIIGIGPGSLDWLAPAARLALENTEVIVGYRAYLKQIEAIAPQTPRESSGMRHEVERARRAIELATEGRRVALVSSGDPGIYGMAGLVLEMLGDNPAAIHAEILPGISALNAAASLLGAPLMTDFAVISLSDLLTPLEDILRRVEFAVQGGFVICLYNPRSHHRTEPFERACQILLKRHDPDTPVGVVKAAYRAEQEVRHVKLSDLPALDLGMDTLVIVGNSSTRLLDGRMVTPRGYGRKYDLGGRA
ncbi:MAG: precorrin-3B C(17)-methyltransferase [Chloroflexi bacterium]|nr:precorrin-3B C(17)-methyltransferase [Chloroflexota bacterium]